MECLNLRLSVPEGLEDGTFSIVARSSAGETDVQISSLPFYQDARRWRTTLIKALGANRYRPSDFPSPDEQQWMVEQRFLDEAQQQFSEEMLMVIGKAVYDSLFPGEIHKLLEKTLGIIQSRESLHIQIEFSKDIPTDSRIPDYPWELACNEMGFLSRQNVLFSRYIAFLEKPPDLPPVEMIRVLLVSASAYDPEMNLAQLDNQEQQSVINGLKAANTKGRIQLTQLKTVQGRATFKALGDYLTEHSGAMAPHVIHFDGHGFFGKRCSRCRTIHNVLSQTHCRACSKRLPQYPQGYLVFEPEPDDERPSNYVSAEEFGQLMRDVGLDQSKEHGIRLVVTSACKTGMALGSDTVFNGVAQGLIKHGVPAVVAMQYNVTVKAASAFAERFYRAISSEGEKTLAAALKIGQGAMTEWNQWYRPILYLRWSSNEGGQLFSNIRSALPTPSSTPPTLSTPTSSSPPSSLVPSPEVPRTLPQTPLPEQALSEVTSETRAVDPILNEPPHSDLSPLPKQRSSRPRQVSSSRSTVRFRRVMLSSVATAVVVFIIRFLGILQSLELGAYDHLVQSRLPEKQDDRIRIIRITEEDKQAQEARKESLDYSSISNASLERLLTKLVNANSLAIGLDLYRETEIDGEAYPQLLRYFQTQPNIFGVCKASEVEVRGDVVAGIEGPFQMPPGRVAFSDLVSDNDSVLRRYLLSFTPDNRSPCLSKSSLALLLASQYLQQEHDISFSPSPSDEEGCAKTVQLSNGVSFKRFLPYTGGYQGERSYGGCQMLINYRSSAPIAHEFSLEEVLNGTVPGKEFEGRVVLIGSVRRALENDYWATPYGVNDDDHMAGVYIQAQMVSHLIKGALKEQAFIWVWPVGIEFLWICLWTLLAAWMGWQIRTPRQLVIASGGLILLLYLICYIMFQFGGWVPLIPTILVTALNIIGVAWFKLYIGFVNNKTLPQGLKP